MTPVAIDLAGADVDFQRRVYREVLLPAFRPDELESEELFLGSVAAGEVMGIALAEPPQTPLSAVVGYPYNTERVLLIGYIATRRELRSQGMGGQLLELAAERWYTPDRFDLVIAEIDDPRVHPGDEATKRVRFYARHGAKLLARPYFQPRLSPEQDRVCGMLLIALWSAPGAGHGDALPGKPIVSFLSTYFAQSEDGCPGDEYYAELLAAYEVSPSVPVIGVCDYPSIKQILPCG